MIRFFIKFFSAGSALAALCLLYGFFIEPKRLVLREHDVAVKDWSGDTLRIGVIADIHIGGYHMPPARVEAITTQLNALDLDMVLIAGDFINGHTARGDMPADFNAAVGEGLKALSQLRAKNTLAVIGNHDVWYDAAYVETALERAEVRVLTNEAANLKSGICVVGLADNLTQTEDIRSFNSCNADALIIALMHSPDSFQYLRSDVSLAIAGHTHAGQINIPFLGRLSTITDLGEGYKHGLTSYGSTPVYISAGLGTSVLPARFRAPPEITVLTISHQP